MSVIHESPESRGFYVCASHMFDKLSRTPRSSEGELRALYRKRQRVV
jgi:hypothetical protein